MGERGILFTAMVFLMILSILALNATVKENRALEQHFTVPAKILRVSGLFENIWDSVIELKKSGTATEIEKRVQPFDYNFAPNTVYAGFGLPVRDAETQTYLDTLNLAKIMLEDKNYNKMYAGLDVNIRTIDWNDATPTYHYLIEPYCYEFALAQIAAQFYGSTSNRCSGTFDFSHVKRIDVNIKIYQPSEDYNRVYYSPNPGFTPSTLCTGANCPKQAYSDSNSQPYFSVTINYAACAGNCIIAQDKISAHYSPTTGARIDLNCAGATCASAPIILIFGEGVSIMHTPPLRTEFSVMHSFDGNVSSFQFLDFNVAVSTPDGKIVKSNYIEAIN
ncbi:MAG: hypothetical protein NT067_06115 [Candidatus Diapherotrites archaeon]|nr:hypothetical protein [Candidatus Diapherotrites archaeon]